MKLSYQVWIKKDILYFYLETFLQPSNKVIEKIDYMDIIYKEKYMHSSGQAKEVTRTKYEQ